MFVRCDHHDDADHNLCTLRSIPSLLDLGFGFVGSGLWTGKKTTNTNTYNAYNHIQRHLCCRCLDIEMWTSSGSSKQIKNDKGVFIGPPSTSSLAAQRLECTRVRRFARPSPSGQLSLSPERSSAGEEGLQN